VPKRGHVSDVTITKIENLHVEKVTDSKILFFRSTTKSSEVIAENRFRTVASPGACERLAVLNKIDARRQYILLVTLRAISLAAQCIVIGPVCGLVCLWVCGCVFVSLLPR